jgi:glycosyltransferase involved in cell wall biosynthesis
MSEFDHDVGVLVFSKDRALQLDGLLRSFYRQVTDAAAVPVSVLFTCSSPVHGAQYECLAREWPCVRFVLEHDFAVQVRVIVGSCAYICFMVDDAMCVAQFTLTECARQLERHRGAVGFSLRLGRNTGYSYAYNRHQTLPEMRGENGVCRFLWNGAEGDFAYPLEVSSSLYRSSDVLIALEGTSFGNPNLFEDCLARAADRFSGQYSQLLCFERSRVFCNPVNKVQNVFDNRAGSNSADSLESLSRIFEDGRRMDAGAYSGMVPFACHQEVSLRLTESEEANPLVSVIVPCYNYGRYLKECVESVCVQTYANVEIVIVDDESNDDSVAVAEALIAAHSPRSIRLIRQKHAGLAAASRNTGMAACQGAYILPLDADDRIAPDMIVRCLSVLRANRGAGFAYTDRRDFGDEEHIVPSRDYDIEALKRANYIPCCSLFRRRVWEDIGGWRLNVNGVEDWDFWLAACVKGWYGVRIAEPLFEYRRHGGGLFAGVLKEPAIKRARVVLNNAEVFTDDDVKKARTIACLQPVLARIDRYKRDGKLDMARRIAESELPSLLAERVKGFISQAGRVIDEV